MIKKGIAHRDVSGVIPGNPNCNELTILFLPKAVAFTMNTDTAIVEQLSQIFQTEVRGLQQLLSQFLVSQVFGYKCSTFGEGLQFNDE